MWAGTRPALKKVCGQAQDLPLQILTQLVVYPHLVGIISEAEAKSTLLSTKAYHLVNPDSANQTARSIDQCRSVLWTTTASACPFCISISLTSAIVKAARKES